MAESRPHRLHSTAPGSRNRRGQSPDGYSGAGQGRGVLADGTPARPARASKVVPASPDFPAESAEKNQDQACGQYDDADGPDDRKLEQKADDQQDHTEDDHVYSLGQ
jgi:hypothetical protein